MTSLQEWGRLRLPGIDSGTVAVVLGAAGAIGGETVRAFAGLGARVAAVARSAGQLDGLIGQLDSDGAGTGQVVAFSADLADSASLARMTDEVAERLDAPDVLVNCAAVGAVRSEVDSVTREQISAIFDVNVVGAFEAVRAVVPAMRLRGGGRIVNVASIAAQRVMPGGGPYGASKAALVSLTQHLAVDLAPFSITVNSVSPGQTPTRLREWNEAPATPTERTPGRAQGGVPLGRRGRLEDYAGAVVFLSSSLADYVTGVDIAVEGGARLVRATAY